MILRSAPLFLFAALPTISCFNVQSHVGDGADAGDVCAVTCGPSEHCSQGLCCPLNQYSCGGVCVDTTTNLDNCGACGASCPGECAGGQCCYLACPEILRCDQGTCKTRFTELPVANAFPAYITAGPDGNVWFTTYGGPGNQIGRVTPDGNLTQFPLPPGPALMPQAPAAGQIVVGPDANLWFTVPLSGQIGRVTVDGGIERDVILFPPMAGTYPVGIAAGSDGNLWFTDTRMRMGPIGLVPSGTSNVGRFTLAGELTEFPVPGRPVLEAIAAGPDGNLWFVETESTAIALITPAGQIQEFPLPLFSVTVSGVTLSSRPIDIVPGPDGNLWFTEADRNSIGRITPRGVLTLFPLSPPSPSRNPQGITVGPDGNLWFLERDADTIGRITPDGEITEFALQETGVGLNDIAAGADGNLWFTEELAGNIGRFIPP